MVQPLFSPDLARSAGLDEHRFPENQEEAEAAEAALTQELEKLSLEEHEHVVFDIHGFTPVEDEDPKVLENNLKEMEEELSHCKQDSAYASAKKYGNYVESKSLRTMFLRCLSYDPKPAVEMMLAHFEVKRQLFGDTEILGRGVRLSDLSPNEMKLLETGFFQALSSRDAAGRTVIFETPPFVPGVDFPPCTLDVMNRVIWYYNMTLLQDTDSQRNGAVLVACNFTGVTADIDVIQQIHAIRNVLPLQPSAVHYCYKDPALKPFVTGFHVFLKGDTRVRVRTHLGSPEEIIFKLQTYGIPTENAPLQKDESWKTTEFEEWMERQRRREADQTLDSMEISIPRRFDVLFGKSKSCREHTGNLRLLHLCEMNYPAYQATNKNRKTEIADRLVSIIHESQGRFLKRSETGWIEVDHVVAREKVAHFFRHLKSKSVASSSEVGTSKKRDCEATNTPAASDGQEESQARQVVEQG